MLNTSRYLLLLVFKFLTIFGDLKATSGMRSPQAGSAKDYIFIIEFTLTSIYFKSKTIWLNCEPSIAFEYMNSICQRGKLIRKNCDVNIYRKLTPVEKSRCKATFDNILDSLFRFLDIYPGYQNRCGRNKAGENGRLILARKIFCTTQ